MEMAGNLLGCACICVDIPCQTPGSSESRAINKEKYTPKVDKVVVCIIMLCDLVDVYTKGGCVDYRWYGISDKAIPIKDQSLDVCMAIMRQGGGSQNRREATCLMPSREGELKSCGSGIEAVVCVLYVFLQDTTALRQLSCRELPTESQGALRFLPGFLWNWRWG